MTEAEANQVALLMRENSLWLTEQLERSILAGQPLDILLSKELAEDELTFGLPVNVFTGYLEVRRLHFARRSNFHKRGGIHLKMIAQWTPPDWAYNLFPLPASDMETVTLQYVVDAMHSEVDLCTEWDSVPLGRVLHVAHMLVSNQEADGLWPAVLNLRTGQAVGMGRSSAPRNLMRRLNLLLQSSEFDLAIKRAEAGIEAQGIAGRKEAGKRAQEAK